MMGTSCFKISTKNSSFKKYSQLEYFGPFNFIRGIHRYFSFPFCFYTVISPIIHCQKLYRSGWFLWSIYRNGPLLIYSSSISKTIGPGWMDPNYLFMNSIGRIISELHKSTKYHFIYTCLVTFLSFHRVTHTNHGLVYFCMLPNHKERLIISMVPFVDENTDFVDQDND